MNTQQHCPQCGTPVAADAPQGMCPACLMKVALATGSGTGGESRTIHPPTLAELANRFPQLEIIELLGKGGMGLVYKARQIKLNRLVALKILPPGIGAEPAFAERFTREAQALARLNHPGIVTLYEFGEASGQFYFLMEYVDGVNLRQLLARGRVSPREALAIVPQICDALQFAHDQGIVHRDIKPENILLDRRGHVKVADFGLAKIMGGPGHEPDVASGGAARSTSLTDASKVMGTPQYMSPEQIRTPGEVDNRADIYALGVVFYQLLTGELPGPQLEPPSRKVLVDVRLDEIVLRALEKQPELRYQQVSEVKTLVETIVATSDANRGRGNTAQVDFESEPAAGGQPDQVAPAGTAMNLTPRFSHAAIVGVCCFGLAVCGLFGARIFLDVWSGTGKRLPEELFALWWALELSLLTAGTILGWVAVTQIRRSAGKLCGLWLAVFDGLLFPLLALDYLVWYLCVVATLVFRNGSDASSRIPVVAGALIVSVLISAMADWFIIRAVWSMVSPLSVSPQKFNTAMNPNFKNTAGYALAVVVLVAAMVAAWFCLRSSQVSHPRLPGLVASWPGENNADAVGGAENGKLSATGVTFAPGKVGMGFRLDGVNGFVSIPDSPALRPAQVTVEAWVWLDPTTPPDHGGEMILFKKNTWRAYFEGYSLVKDHEVSPDGVATDRFGFVVSSHGRQVIVHSTTVVQRGVWYHVAGTYDGARSTLWVNGVAEGAATPGFALDYGRDPVYIGTSGTWPPYLCMFAGIIDEPSIYNRALSAAEIKQLYNAVR